MAYKSILVHPCSNRPRRTRAGNADLIVMGAYGHGRMRELVLGGVTHTLLDSMTAPVLFSR